MAHQRLTPRLVATLGVESGRARSVYFDTHDDAPKDMKAPSGEVHIHADGKKHVHDAPAPATAKPAAADPHAGMDMPETAPASDGHDHQH